jgi:hypothetical protein
MRCGICGVLGYDIVTHDCIIFIILFALCNPEPIRDCEHKNSLKNNDNDGLLGCTFRGGG